jgi:hypothetical protein
MRKLPIVVQSFEEIRKGKYYYTDKTYFVKNSQMRESTTFCPFQECSGNRFLIDTFSR